jgi:hypothetical protein
MENSDPGSGITENVKRVSVHILFKARYDTKYFYLCKNLELVVLSTRTGTYE